MLENCRVGGEGRHFDQVDADAVATSRQIASMTNLFKAAVRLGDDVAMPQWNGRRETLTDMLASEVDDTRAALLLKALSLTMGGKYEAGSKALLAFGDAMAEYYATQYVELSQ